MSDYIDLFFDIFDEKNQHASVRESLTVADLIDEITREFDDLDRETLDSYALFLQDKNQPLNGSRNLLEQGVQPGDRLVFTWARSQLQSARRPLSDTASFALQDETSQVLFPIEWQPAVIGRPDTDLEHNDLLAVDLRWLPESPRVSRRHAQITEVKGVYYIESLTPNNPTYLNGHGLSLGKTYKLKVGDTIRFGYTDIRLRYISQSTS
jgi:hypothetical protein